MHYTGINTFKVDQCFSNNDQPWQQENLKSILTKQASIGSD